MSDWPVVGVWCTYCPAHVFVYEVGLGACHSPQDQETFAKALQEKGWETHSLPDAEVDDEGFWMVDCPRCKHR